MMMTDTELVRDKTAVYIERLIPMFAGLDLYDRVALSSAMVHLAADDMALRYFAPDYKRCEAVATEVRKAVADTLRRLCGPVMK